MKTYAPYLRVLAGLVAAVATWLAIVHLIKGRFPDALIGLLLAAGLWYLAVGKPIRQHFARIAEENAGLAARAQAGHEAYLAGDPAAFAPPPKPTPRAKVRRGVIIAAILAAVFVLIGVLSDIGGGLDKESKSGPATTTVPTTAPAASAASRLGASDPSPSSAAGELSAADAPSAITDASGAVPPGAAASDAVAVSPAVMPQVVCMNLQDAQDSIQSAGVFYSQSTDATGKGRKQVLDRNWVVVGQSPAAGTTIGEGDAMLSVVKAGERGDCS